MFGCDGMFRIIMTKLREEKDVSEENKYLI